MILLSVFAMGVCFGVCVGSIIIVALDERAMMREVEAKQIELEEYRSCLSKHY